eukprot:201964-Rhodomonas_salina.2
MIGVCVDQICESAHASAGGIWSMYHLGPVLPAPGTPSPGPHNQRQCQWSEHESQGFTSGPRRICCGRAGSFTDRAGADEANGMEVDAQGEDWADSWMEELTPGAAAPHLALASSREAEVQCRVQQRRAATQGTRQPQLQDPAWD